jgi:ATP-binding cassette subfamily B protein
LVVHERARAARRCWWRRIERTSTSRTRESPPNDEFASEPGWLRKLWPFLVRHKKGVLIAFGVAILGQVITSILPLVQRAIVDNTITTQTEPIGPLLVLLVGLAAVNFVFQYIRRYSGGRYGIDVRTICATRCSNVSSASTSLGTTSCPPVRARVAASSTSSLVQQLLQFMPMLTGNVVLLVLSLFLMLLMSPLLTLLTFLTVPALLIVSLRLRKKMYPRSGIRSSAGEVAGVVDEAVTGVRVVKGFGQEDREINTLAGVAEGLYGSRAQHPDPGQVLVALAAIPAFGQVGVLAPAIPRDPRPDHPRHLPRFATYLAQLLAPVRMMANIIGRPTDAPPPTGSSTSSTRTRRHREARCARARRERRSRRRTRQLRLSAAEPVLADFSRCGSHRARPSPSLACRARASRPSSLLLPLLRRARGSITIDGVDITDATLDSLRREVGVVSRTAFLFSDSVRNNIAYGRPDADRRRRPARAQVAGASIFIEALPNGYDTMVGEAGSHSPAAAPTHRHRPRCAHRPACSCSTMPRRRSTPAPRSDPRDAARDHGAPHHHPRSLTAAPRCVSPIASS